MTVIGVYHGMSVRLGDLARGDRLMSLLRGLAEALFGGENLLLVVRQAGKSVATGKLLAAPLALLGTTLALEAEKLETVGKPSEPPQSESEAEAVAAAVAESATTDESNDTGEPDEPGPAPEEDPAAPLAEPEPEPELGKTEESAAAPRELESGPDADPSEDSVAHPESSP